MGHAELSTRRGSPLIERRGGGRGPSVLVERGGEGTW